MNSKNLKGLCEAYGGIYTPQELTEEQVWEEVETWVNSLLEEGYDLSDYTWEEMFEAYIEEQGGRGSTAPRNQNGNPNASSAIRNVAKSTIGSTPIGLVARNMASQPPAPPGTGARRGAAPRPQAPSIRDGRNSPPSAQVRIPTTPPKLNKDKEDSAPTPGTPAPANRTPGVTPAPAAPAKPSGGQTGDKTKDMATFAKANPKLAASAAERARTRGTSATTNPLMGDMKSRMPAPSTPSPTTTSTAFSKSTPSISTPMSSSSNYSSAKVSPSANVIGKKDQKSLASSFEWGSTSKLVDGIANAISVAVYEAKKVDQDKDGDNDFADVRIARLIASGVSKEEAIRRVKDKSYNEEVEIDEATRMRRELGKEGEIATRKELASRSKAYQRSGSVDRTIAAAERGAYRILMLQWVNRDETEADYSKRKQET
jgi:hypothetical protein